jgi:peptide/nickel transport system substrate-binding protein
MTAVNDPRLAPDLPGGLTPPRVTRRRILQIGGMGALGLALAACATDSGSAQGTGTSTAAGSGQSQRGGTAQFALTSLSSGDSADPALTSQSGAAFATSAIYETLLLADNNLNLTGQLAKNWSVSTDAKTWTVAILDGVTFSDGSPLTAEDVAYTFARLLNPKLGSSIQSSISSVLTKNGITVVDAQKIVFHLTAPDSFFGLVLANGTTGIVKTGTTNFLSADTALGTGPFKLKSFVPGQSWEVVRNTKYRDPSLPYLDGMQAVATPDSTSKLEALLSGQADYVDGIDPTQVTKVASSNVAQVQVTKNTGYTDIVMDMTVAPFNDLRVVEAIKLATDRKSIVDLANGGFGTIGSDVPTPSDDPFFPASLANPKRDVQRAKQLLAEAGHPNGIDLTLQTTDVTYGMVDTAVTFAQSVNEAGIRVKVQQDPVTNYFSDVFLHAPFYTNYWGRRPVADALNVAYRSDAAWNESKHSSPRLDELIDQGSATTDVAEQKKIFGEALEIVASQFGTLVPVQVDEATGHSARFHVPAPSEYNFWKWDWIHAWLDQH